MYKKNEPSPWNFGVDNFEPLPIRRAILSGVVLPFTWMESVPIFPGLPWEKLQIESTILMIVL
jgi:hypothetical protein